jgi:hypothetical protein
MLIRIGKGKTIETTPKNLLEMKIPYPHKVSGRVSKNGSTIAFAQLYTYTHP